MQRVTYHAVRLISWGLCWSSSLSHMILQPEVSTHSRDSVQFPYVFGIYLGCADATAGDPRVAPAQRGHPSPTERPPGVEAADPRRREHRRQPSGNGGPASRSRLRRERPREPMRRDRKSTRLNSSHLVISYAVFCLKKKKK